MLLSITPIDEFMLPKAMWSSLRISGVGLRPAKVIGLLAKTISHVDICNRALEDLSLLNMPAGVVKKNKDI